MATAELVGVTTSGAFATGSNYTVVSTAERAGLPMALLLSGGIAAAPAAVPVVAQPLWAAPPITSVAAGTTTGAGTWSTTIAIPNRPALRWRAFQLFAAGIANGQVQLSAMVGGVLR